MGHGYASVLSRYCRLVEQNTRHCLSHVLSPHIVTAEAHRTSGGGQPEGLPVSQSASTDVLLLRTAVV